MNSVDLRNTLSILNSSIIGRKLLEGEVIIEDSNKKINLIIRPTGSLINDFITFLSPQLSLAGLGAKVTGSLKVRIEEFKGISDVGLKNINDLLSKQIIKIKTKVR